MYIYGGTYYKGAGLLTVDDNFVVHVVLEEVLVEAGEEIDEVGHSYRLVRILAAVNDCRQPDFPTAWVFS